MVAQVAHLHTALPLAVVLCSLAVVMVHPDVVVVGWVAR
jgi:hypothetical protein